jgi:hypothetical protein
MLLSEFKTRLDEIAWHEQIEHELSERVAASPPDLDRIEAELRALAASVDSALLDTLEQEAGYLIWALRLAPFVEPARAQQRARPYIDSPNWRVRTWARRVAGVDEAGK